MTLRVWFITGLVTTILLAGCGAFAPTPTPTPPPTPLPTSTPLPPPSPTATLPKPTATKANTIPPAVAFALNKTQGAHSMKFEFESAVTTTQNGQPKKIPGLALKGLDSTLDRQVTISGTTSDTNEFITYDVVVLGNDVYIKGLSGNGLDEKQWYQLPEQMQAGVRRLPTARGLMASFDPADVGKAQFQAAGNESVDDENCSVWSAQNAAFAQTLVGVTEGSEMAKQLGEIDSAEFKIWTCGDGFIHRMTGEVQGHATANKENKSSVTLNFAMSDFETAFEIQPPSGAKPFPSAPTAPTPSATTSGNATSSPTETKSATPTPTP